MDYLLQLLVSHLLSGVRVLKSIEQQGLQLLQLFDFVHIVIQSEGLIDKLGPVVLLHNLVIVLKLFYFLGE